MATEKAPNSSLRGWRNAGETVLFEFSFYMNYSIIMITFIHPYH